MSEWKAKRFWSDVSIEKSGCGYGIRLDYRSLQTPAKVPLIVPTKSLADAVAKEWRLQDSAIDPETMPFTRTANAAIDKVSVQKAEVADLLAAYGDTDLLCYRAEFPTELVERQQAAWDPLLDWAADELGVQLRKHVGIMHQPQKSADLTLLSQRVHELGNFQLAAFHDLVGLSGSLIIGFATILSSRTAQELWQASRTDELWQEEKWGVDEEAQLFAEQKRSDFLHAANFINLCKQIR